MCAYGAREIIGSDGGDGALLVDGVVQLCNLIDAATASVVRAAVLADTVSRSVAMNNGASISRNCGVVEQRACWMSSPVAIQPISAQQHSVGRSLWRSANRRQEPPFVR